MVEPITARYLWDSDEMAEALAAHQRQSLRPSFRFLLNALILLAIVASLGIPASIFAFPLTSPEIRRNSVIALIVIGAAWVWVITGVRSKRFLKGAAQRIFRSTPGGSEFVEWSIGPDHLSNRSELTASTILWRRFVKVVESPAGFMLYQSVQMFNWIPGHAFASENELRRFAGMARERVAKYVLSGKCQHVGKPEPIDPDAF